MERKRSCFSQEFVNRTQNVEGFWFLEGFEMGSLPVWFYRVKGIEIEKTIGMVQGRIRFLSGIG